ncbi:MAG: hypothetical protein ACNA7O_16035 [Rhodobacterales bacterium]
MTDNQSIHRRLDGSIDYDHYDRIARSLRSHDQRAALILLATLFNGLLKALRSYPVMRVRGLLGVGERRLKHHDYIARSPNQLPRKQKTTGLG